MHYLVKIIVHISVCCRTLTGTKVVNTEIYLTVDQVIILRVKRHQTNVTVKDHSARGNPLYVI